MKQGRLAKWPQVGSRRGEGALLRFVISLTGILGQGWEESTSCGCAHLISQLTKYYSLPHKNQSSKLPGVLNSRSCDQKQAVPGMGWEAAAGPAAPTRPSWL